MSRRILLLAGTTEATRLATELQALGEHTIVSLAGRTVAPVLPPGDVRIGGFGGPYGLVAYLRTASIDLVVDATHPFAAQMSTHAAIASAATGVALIRVERPAWTPVDGDRWTTVGDLDAAARVLAELGARRVLITTGRQELTPFARLTGMVLVVRSIDPPELAAFRSPVETVLDRGPFTVESESTLMRDHRIDTLVSKNSGGAATAAKLTAARMLGVGVVMVDRPRLPVVPTVATVDAALAAIARIG